VLNTDIVFSQPQLSAASSNLRLSVNDLFHLW